MAFYFYWLQFRKTNRNLEHDDVTDFLFHFYPEQIKFCFVTLLNQANEICKWLSLSFLSIEIVPIFWRVPISVSVRNWNEKLFQQFQFRFTLILPHFHLFNSCCNKFNYRKKEWIVQFICKISEKYQKCNKNHPKSLSIVLCPFRSELLFDDQIRRYHKC